MGEISATLTITLHADTVEVAISHDECLWNSILEKILEQDRALKDEENRLTVTA